MYEANPLAFIAEQAGGMATDGFGKITDIQPETIHQRTPLVIGSQAEMQAFAQCVQEVDTPLAAGR
jgi:fructose-1,6-bisphosphatase I